MDTMQSVAFGTLLRRHRIAAGLTQEELAERACVSVRSVGDMERGVAHIPRKDTIALLAEALALSPRDRSVFAAAARRQGASTAYVPGFASTSTPPFVGRTRELALLERHLAGEGPPVLLLAGEPGIGKTRLLRAAIPRAVVQGLRVLEGGCQRRGGQEPYAPLLGALQRHIRNRRPVQLRAELAGCAWLVRLLPELATGPIEPLPGWTLAPEQERRLMFEAVVRFLTNGAGPAGTLLVLDDLQWAGRDALDLLAMLARSAAEVPLRVLGAYRDTEVQPQDPLSFMLADLAHAGLAARRLLGPLAPLEAQELLDGLLPGGADNMSALREWVLRRTGGVPFFLVSYAQAVHADTAGRDISPGAGEQAIPWDVAQTIRQRVAALPGEARDLLAVAAVAGRMVGPALLSAVTTQAERDVLTGLEAASGARLLEEEQRAYRFAHDVIREVIEADLGAARRMVLHRRVAEVLERRPPEGEPPLERLAYHYTQSDVPGKAVLYLERAGDRARQRHAFTAAEGYYRDAVERLEGLGRALDAAAVRVKLGAVLHTVAHFDAALPVLEEAARVYSRAGDLEGLARVTAQIGEICAITSQPHEGLRILQPVHEALRGAAPSHGLAALIGTFPRLLHLTGQYAAALAAADRAVALARAIGDQWLLAEALWQRGYILLEHGPLEEALRASAEANRLAAAVDHPDILGRTCIHLASAETDRGAWDTAGSWAARAVDVAERLDNPPLLAFALGTRSRLAFFTGEWPRARADLERALALQGQPGRSWYRYSFSLLGLGQLAYAEGASDQAADYLEQAIAAAEHDAAARVLFAAHSLLAERDLREGRPTAARARLTSLLDRLGREHLGVLAALPVLAWAGAELGDTEVATAMAAAALTRARAERARPALADVLRVQALVDARRGDLAAGQRALAEGLALARNISYPYAEARLLHVYGAMHAHKGEPEAARQRLEAALAIFRRLGACKDAERVEQAIGSLSQTCRSQPLETAVTDAQWAQIQDLLPPSRHGRGRPRADDRRTLEAILYVQRTGCSWAELPVELGDDATAHRRFQRWQAEGIWASICQILGLRADAVEGRDGTWCGSTVDAGKRRATPVRTSPSRHY